MGRAERRVDSTDGVAYSWAQFVEHYGETKGNKIWEAVGNRVAPQAKAKVKAKAKAKTVKSEVPEQPFHLTYFGVMAKGLAAHLVAELSGRPFTHTQFKDPAEEWRGDAGLKATGKCAFGQVPLLEVPARGKMPGQNIVQTTAICNYIARIAKRKAGLEGIGAAEYAMSQMLMAEGEDLYNGLAKNQTTVFVKEYGGGKNSKEDSQKWWAETAKEHTAMLEKLLGSTEGPAFTKSGTSAGEIHLFSMLHQMKLVKGNILDDAKGLLAWYDATKANPSVATVLDADYYKQYFVDH